MTLYTIRANSIFTIELNGVIYGAGDSVDLDEQEFELHKHKLEGVDQSYIPLEFPNPYQEQIDDLQNQIDNLSGGNNSSIKTFRSPEINYLRGARLSFAHGWENFDPSTAICVIQPWAVCTAEDGGFVPGDRIMLNGRRMSLILDPVFIYMQIGRSGIIMNRLDSFLNEWSLSNNRWLIYIKGVWYAG